MSELASKLRLGRAVLGWSQGELARRAGTYLNAVFLVEAGKTERYSTKMLMALAEGGVTFVEGPHGVGVFLPREPQEPSRRRSRTPAPNAESANPGSLAA